MKKFSAARQDFCRAAGFLPEPPRFGRSVTDFPSFQLFPTFRPFGRRFSNVSAVRPPFLTFWPCERRFRRVLAGLHRNLRDRGARGTFSRFPPFWPFGHRFRTFRPFGHRFRTYRPFRPPFSNVSAAPPPFPHVSPLRTPFSQCLGRCAP